MAEIMQALAKKEMAVSAPRMGRPPLGVKKTTVRLPVGVLDRIEALVGKQRLATFIREAVERELDRRGK